MPEFDPYAAWLDIPPHHQPPQPWRLLAVPPNCHDPQQLRNAANRAEQRVRQAASPEHGAWVERLCVEIRAAERAMTTGPSTLTSPTHQETPLSPPTPAPPTSAPATLTSSRVQEQPLAPPNVSSPPSPLAPTNRAAPLIQSPPTPGSRPTQPPTHREPPHTPSIDQPIQSPPPPGAAAHPAAPHHPEPLHPAPQPAVQPPTSPKAPSPTPIPHSDSPHNPGANAGPLPLGPPLSGGVPQSTHSEPWLASPVDPQEHEFPELPSQSEGPSATVIVAVSLSCFLLGVVVMLIFIMLR